MFSEFLIPGGAIFQVSGPKYLKLVRLLLTVLIYAVVKSVYD